MEDEIVLENDDSGVVKLNDEEADLLNEIEIKPVAPRKPKKVVFKKPRPPPPPQSFEEQAEEPEIEAFMNPNKQSVPRKPPPVEYDYGEDEYDDEEEEMFQNDEPRMSSEDQPSEGYKSIDEEKADLLNKLTRLEKKGFKVNKRLNAYSPVEDLRTEVKRITYSIEVDQSIKFSRRMLVACVTGLEFLNKKYNPLELQLEGWSESVMENLDDYDGVFEELHAKYKSKIQVAPEVKLIMMLGGSGMMFHLTNSMFKAAVPNMNDIIKQNPNLVNDMVNAVKNTVPKSQQPPTVATNPGGRYEMQGPGLDISSFMTNMMPPPPINTTPMPQVEQQNEPREEIDDRISDIISVSGESTGGELKDINIPKTKGKRGKKSKNEVTLD